MNKPIFPIQKVKDDLDSFTFWYLNNRPFSPPPVAPVSHTDKASGIVLYRKGIFQVELFIGAPNSIAPSHIHPNIDSYELHICGDMVFTIGGVLYNPPKPGLPVAPTRINHNCWHEGVSGPIGGAFLSIQKWLNGVQPTSVLDDWHDKAGNTRGLTYGKPECDRAE
jgi:hypothetical protein